LSRAIQSLPDNPHLFRLRADLYAQQTRWKEAAADHARGLALAPDNHEEWARCAALLAATGDWASYRRHCREMLARYRGTGDPIVAERIAKACLLLPGAPDDLDGVLKLCDRAFAAASTHWAYRYFELARGLAEYRRGNGTAALEWLGKSQAAGRSSLNRPAQARALFLQALAHHQLKQDAQARQAWEKACRLAEKDFASLRAGSSSDWHGVLLCWLAHAEAGRALRLPTAGGSAP
jgi:tetratricopeptide (TPR) repeat protein